MSSKSSSSSRTSSPRAMPVETIITRFKSAQQKRKLREMDRSMNKVTELLKNPLKPKIKKKVPLKKDQSSSSTLSINDDDEEEKRTKKDKEKTSEKLDSDEEYCPMNLKRNIVSNKVRLKPKHELKVIAQANKRKRSLPKKGFIPQDSPELSVDSDNASRDVSPKAKRTRSLTQDMTMDEMIQLIEDSGSLNDEDLLEILTCPSPVWWEDPPDGYVEDALFTRPRSTAEMYPSIRSQLQEDLQERQRSSTPNILSRRERIVTERFSNIDVEENETEEVSGNDNDIDLEISLSKCDEKFIKKRSKLESVLGNLKNKTSNHKDVVDTDNKPMEISDCGHNSDNLSNKVSVIKNLSTDQVIKPDGKFENEINKNEEIIECVSVESESESTDDERLTDISFQDDLYLNDLENMDIPIQRNTDTSPKKQLADTIQENTDASVNKEIADAGQRNTDPFLKKLLTTTQPQPGLNLFPVVEEDNKTEVKKRNKSLDLFPVVEEDNKTEVKKRNKSLDLFPVVEEDNKTEVKKRNKSLDLSPVIENDNKTETKKKIESLDLFPVVEKDNKTEVKKKNENLNLFPVVNNCTVTEIEIKKKNESLNLFPVINKNNITEVTYPNFKEPTYNQHARADVGAFNDCSLNKYRPITFNHKSIDHTYSDKNSSIIEDYLEMELFVEDDVIVNESLNEFSKSPFNTFPCTPLKRKNDSKHKDTNVTSSVIKFKHPDDSSINVFKIESLVPKILPPLINTDRRKCNSVRPEYLPPLSRNPGVIHLNSESPKSNQKKSLLNTSGSYNNVLIHGNMDSISGTNICFLNKDSGDCCIEKKNGNEFGGSILSTVIKSNNVNKTNELSSHNLNHTRNGLKNNRNIFPANQLHFTPDIGLYNNFTQINSVNGYNELEFQSLTITKVNDNNCCKVEEKKLDTVVMKKNDITIMNCDKEQHTKTDLYTVKSKTCSQKDFNSPINNNEVKKKDKESAECVTVYKIISDDSGNEEPKNNVVNKTTSPKDKAKDSQDIHKSEDANDKKLDGNKDKMIFYYKKCKNLYWKHKRSDRNDDKKLESNENEVQINKNEVVGAVDSKDKSNVDNVISNKINNTASADKSREEKFSVNNNKESNNRVNHNNNLTGPDKNEQKCIIVSNTKQIRYCMKCSSIFDTAQCNYCYRKFIVDHKNQPTDYLLKMEQCFVCDVCRYKALSKDSLERHISSRCCNSKHR